MDAVRLIASDMDHTLLDENGELPPGFHEYVRRLNAAGVTFVAASGRPPVRLKLMFPPREGIGHIGDNGGTVSYHDTILFQSLLATRSYHDMAARTLASTQGVPVICGVDAAFAVLDPRERVERSRPVEAFEMRQQSAPLVLAEAGEAPLDALGELAGGLAGEGQPEHLVAADEAVRDEPDDAPRHRLGLAAAGPRDDEGGSERRGDHRRLLGGGRELSERGGDRLG